MSTAVIQLPDTVSEGEARLLLAVKLLEAGRVSCGQAAEISGYSKRAFMELLGRQQVCVFNGPVNELVRDLADA